MAKTLRGASKRRLLVRALSAGARLGIFRVGASLGDQTAQILYQLSRPLLRGFERLYQPLVVQAPRQFNIDDVQVEPGYHIEPLVMNLSIPTTLIFNGQDMLVAESGFIKDAPPRVLRIKPDWTTEVVADKGLNGPVTGLLVHQNQVYISHRGKVSIAQSDGGVRDIVTGLPSSGDHQNNQIVMGPDGKIYLGQGTHTNSAVVGIDNYLFNWLQAHPEAHDDPCQDVTLTGQNFTTENPLTEAHDKVTTGAYQPFGTPTQPGQVVHAKVPCNGAILRFNPDGSELEVYASGVRNPFGLAVDANGQLWCTHHGADVRGSRPIANDPDYLIKLEQGAWYGWPDYFEDKPVTHPQFHELGKPQPEFLWSEHPPLAQAYMHLPKDAGSNGLAFSSHPDFGFVGDLFIALFGSYVPATTGLEYNLHGFRVARVDLNTKQLHDFVSNKLPGPAYFNLQHGLDRPADVTFGPDGSMYFTDWGASTFGPAGIKLEPLTGAIWRVYKEGMSPRRPQGPLAIDPPPQVPESQRKALLKNAPELYRMYANQLRVLAVALVLVVGVSVLVLRAFKTVSNHK